MQPASTGLCAIFWLTCEPRAIASVERRWRLLTCTAVLAPWNSRVLGEAGPALGCTGCVEEGAEQKETFIYYGQEGKFWSPQLYEGSVGLLPSLPFARHAQFNRA